MQSQLIRSRRSRTRWIAAGLALLIPLYLVLVFQHGVTQAQEGEQTETATPTYPDTSTPTITKTETGTPTLTEPPVVTGQPSATLSLTYSPTDTLTRTPRSITNTPTITSSATKTNTRTKTNTPYITPTDTMAPTETAGITPIPPDAGSCPPIPYPGVPPLPGGRGLYPGSMAVTYFNDVGRMDYLLDGPINWGTLTAPAVSTWYLSSVDFNWNGQPPTAGVNGVFWSACFQGYLQVPADGTYTFYLDNLDDGGVLYVGDLATPVISSWLVQGPHFYQADVTLTEGITPIRLLYAQGPGTQSSVTLAWSSAYFEKEVIRGATAKYATPTPTSTKTPTITETWTDTATIHETPSGALPDLIISSAHISSKDGLIDGCRTAGYSPQLSVTVRNNGDADAGSFVVDVNGTQLTVDGLAAAASTTLWFSRFGNLTITADFYDSVAESDEGNNTYSYFFPTVTPPPLCTSTRTPATPTLTDTPTWTDTPTITDTSVPTVTDTVRPSPTSTSKVLPDLVISSVDYTSPGYDGQCLIGGYNPRLRVKVSNIGIGDAGPFVVDVNGTQLSVGGLAAGEDLILWFNRIGNLTITADINNSVLESNESNNVTTFNSPTPSRPPDCTFTPTVTSSTLENTPTPTETKEITDTPSQTYTHTKSPTNTPTSNREVYVYVVNASGEPLEGIPVSFSSTINPNINPSGNLTDSSGKVRFVFQYDPTLYFVVKRHGTLFWSSSCRILICRSVMFKLPDPVEVTVLDSAGNPQAGLTVRAYSGNAYAGVEGTTDAQGMATLWMPAGNYRFRAVKDGTIYWSGSQNHCAISGCSSATIHFNNPVTVTVIDLDGQPQAGVPVMAFDGTRFTGASGTTDAQGQVSFTLPDGSYRFRAYKNNRFFWSGGSDHCAVPGCTAATITVDNVVVVTVLDGDGNPQSGLNVLVYDGSAYAGYAAYTDAQGQATLSLPAGSYRFRVAKNGTAFWSGPGNHCTVPGCTSAGITVNLPVTVTVLNLNGQPEAGLIVQAYSGSAWAGYTATTDAQGQVSFTLPDGSYRFRVYKNSRTFWSGETDHCAVPGCTSAAVTVDDTVLVTVLDSGGNPQSGLSVQAYNGSTYTGYSLYTDGEGRAAMTLPAGEYRFRVVKGGTAFWSGPANHCTVPGCSSAGITINLSVTVTVLNLDSQPEAGISVVAYIGTTYAGYSGTTNAQGQVTFTMADGSYRFRAAKGNRFFWSGAENHCTVPGCSNASIAVDNTVIVTVLDPFGNPESDLNVLAYSGSTYAGYAAYTNAQGQAALVLPAGNYRFRVAKNGTAFWSGTVNHCTVPGCTSVSIITTAPVVVTVLGSGSQPEVGLTVSAYDGSAYAGYSAVTGSSGQVSLTLPPGSYRFRAAKGGDFFWSGPVNHCTVPGCTMADITTGSGALAFSVGVYWPFCTIVDIGEIKCRGKII
jgi:hypothetical protein